MNILKRMLQISISTFMVALCILLFKPLPVDAATPFFQWLNTYTESFSFDVTGDGEKDVIRLDYDEDNNLIVKVNDQTAFTTDFDDEYGFGIGIGVLKNNKSFLIFNDINEDNSYLTLYQITKTSDGYRYQPVNRLTSVLDIDRYGTWLKVDKVKVKGNTITIDYRYISHSLGYSICRYTYTYKNGKIKKDSNIGSIIKCEQINSSNKTYYSRKFTVNKKMNVYKYSSGKKKIMTLKKGNKVLVDKITYTKKKGVLVRVKYKKKRGWVRLSTNYKTKLFKNVSLYND